METLRQQQRDCIVFRKGPLSQTRHSHENNVPSDEEAQDDKARGASHVPNTGSNFFGDLLADYRQNGRGRNARRRARTWSSPQDETDPTRLLSSDAAVPSSDDDESSISSLESSESSMAANHDNEPRRRRRRGGASTTRRMQSLRIGLVVVVYLGLATQPRRLLPPYIEDLNVLSPQHGREIVFPPPAAKTTAQTMDEPRDLSKSSKRGVNRLRPVVAHAHVSSQAAPVFVLKRKPPTTTKQSSSPLAMLPWLVLLWLVLETGCREAQSRFRQVIQRRQRDLWQQRRLDE